MQSSLHNLIFTSVSGRCTYICEVYYKSVCWSIIGRTLFLISGSRSPSPVKNHSVAGSRSPSPAKSKSRSPSPRDEDAQSNSGSERSARVSDNEDKTSVKSGADDDKSGLFMNYELVGSCVVVFSEQFLEVHSFKILLSCGKLITLE